MRTLFFLCLLTPCAASFLLGACGGNDNVTGATDGGNDSTAQDSASADGASDRASDVSTDTATDARQDASDGGAEAGPGSGPGKIGCGSATCDIDGGQACCDTVAADASTHQCGSLAQGSFCPFGATQTCDKKADCTTGVCCIQFLLNGIQASCLPTCITGAERYQACATSAECESAGTCAVHTGCSAGETVQTCEKPRQCQ